MFGINYKKFDSMTYVIHFVNGKIKKEGIRTDFIKFNSGAIATIGIADEKAKIVIG